MGYGSRIFVNRKQSRTSNLGQILWKKLKLCMTLFSQLPNASPCFELVLQKYYSNKKDTKTLQIL
ncbi:DUF1810 family protein [Flavobacterium sp. 7E]|uniref:DUF1810 family protein n=1 Tax=Flavobacterium sp. 7E TaxID=2735898 RepID=UPI0015707573